MSDLSIVKLDELKIRIECDPGIAQELSDAFEFIVPGFQYTPAYKFGRWSGKIRLFDVRKRTMYAGLLSKVLKFAAERDYSVDGYLSPPSESTERAQISSWAATLGLPGITPRDYQIDALRAVTGLGGRSLVLSPTGSGKSLLAYMLYRWYNRKTLLIVPNVGLVHQMNSDFEDYNCPDDIQIIHEGETKDVRCNLVITTWQSIYKLGKAWFDQFDMVIGDECHLFKANCLTKIMEKLDECPIRIGLTGTLDDSKINGLTLEGLFGPIFKSTTTAELIEQKVLADFNIECLVLKYTDEERKVKRSYDDEINFIVSHPQRNALIRQLVTKLEGNVLVLFQFVEKHGKELLELIKKSTNRPVFYISGEIKPAERERIRKAIEKEENVILIASAGTTSTGLNIVSLRHIVFTSPSKAKIRTLQSIGRVLRRSKYKTKATLWDIADDLSWKSRKNFTLLHFVERIKIYAREQFKYKVRNINLK